MHASHDTMINSYQVQINFTFMALKMIYSMCRLAQNTIRRESFKIKWTKIYCVFKGTVDGSAHK